jgi:hypothetical protein
MTYADDEERVLTLMIEVFETNRYAAMAYYRNNKIVGFGCKTMEELVKDGHAEAVIEHIRAGEVGGFA